ncbi:hypothetical protein [Nocardioides terrisoli]|uniref:hypothetical protein n=1 Tax=Nocardioides terrisoli TaxID=3388267 RepID=UPI00287B6DEF|nr:hypothetical protein [Nocardioides marmorisolisilvae]
MSVLIKFLTRGSPPHWTDQVKSEVLAGIATERCRLVLQCAALGQPEPLPDHLFTDVFKMQRALGGGGESGEDHLGEAECLVLAEANGWGVITDDNAAYDLASKRLGSARTHDTIDILHALVAHGDLEAIEAKQLTDAIRNNGRYLRRVHPTTLIPDYFR